jgi:hypothetical protein
MSKYRKIIYFILMINIVGVVSLSVMYVQAIQRGGVVGVIGDSLLSPTTVGVLERWYPEYTFELESIEGITPKQLYNMIANTEELDISQYSSIIYLVGINGISDPTHALSHMSRMFKYTKERGIEVIVVSLLPCGNYELWSPEIQFNIAYINDYLHDSQKYGGSVDIYIDAYADLGGGENSLRKDVDRGDGLHLNKKGQIELGEIIGDALISF